MLKKLFKLANKLDKAGYPSLADDIDNIVKTAIELSPEKEKEIEDSVDRYFADPEKQKRNELEQRLGLLDTDDIAGLEPNWSWHNFKYSYEGVPDHLKDRARPHTRYQTVIISDEDKQTVPDRIEENGESAVWIMCSQYTLEPAFGSGEFSTKPGELFTYELIPIKDLKRREENLSIPEEFMQDEVEATEAPEDVVEVEEESKQHGGGVRLF